MADPVAFLQVLIRAQRDGEAAVQQRVADAARQLGCTVERVRYRPGDVPMVAEFASAQAIDTGAASSSSPIPTASRSRRPSAGGTIPSPA